MKTITINDTVVHDLGSRGDWSKFTLISLAANSDTFSIEHEQDAYYGRLEVFTLSDGLWATIHEIDERQIENEALGDRWGLAFAKTVDERWNGCDPEADLEDIVRYWKIEAFERVVANVEE